MNFDKVFHLLQSFSIFLKLLLIERPSKKKKKKEKKTRKKIEIPAFNCVSWNNEQFDLY